MFSERLEEIGFTTNEAKIYMELLKIGPQAVSVIAKRLGYNRTSVYMLLKTLEEKGIVSSYKNNTVKYFIGNDPNCLIGYLDRKCRAYDYYRSEILASIPLFREVVGAYDFKKPIVSYFDGIEGVKHVLYDSLNSEGECLSYLALHKWFELGLKDFLLDYKDFRIESKKTPLRAITPDTKEVRNFFKENCDPSDKMTKILYVSDPHYFKLFENEMSIYNGRVSIISLNKGDEYGVVIQSKEIANMHRMIFDMAWKGFELKQNKKV